MPQIEMIVVKSSSGHIDHLPLDYHPTEAPFFVERTRGHGVVLGHKTLLELARTKKRNTKLLPGRQIYVLTQDTSKVRRFEDCIAITSIDDIVRLTTRIKLVVSGGESLYNQFILLPNLVGAIHVAKICVNNFGTKKFPELASSKWIARKSPLHYPAGNESKYATLLTTYIPAIPIGA